MSFKNITPEEYDRLIKNKNRIFDLTFKTPEVLNKYRNDKNIYDEIKYSVKQNKKIDNYNKILEDNFNKHLPKKNYNKNEKTLLNVLENLEDTVKQSNDSNDIDIVKNVFKHLSKKKDYINYDDLKNEINFDNFKKSDNENDNNYNINFDYLKNEINFDNFKKSDNENENKFNKYKFDTDEDIIKSFKKIFREKHISYKPYSKSKHKIKYLLDKLKYHEKVPKDLFEYFNTELNNKEKLEHKIPIDKIISKQDGYGVFSTNKIKINTDLLNKNILSIRYLTGRKLTNKLLRDDYKISKNMVNAIKFNKDIHKLSKNEKNVYYELQKYLNKDQDINVLIGSYLAGNNSKDLFNKINKVLYDKYKNNLINQKAYTNLLSKINNV